MAEQNDNLDDTVKRIVDKLNVPVDWARHISPEEILFLLDKVPFLQMLNPDAGLVSSEDVRVVQANSGWDIQVYGNDSMASSPGRLMMGGGFRTGEDDDEEGGGGQLIDPCTGTVVKQAWDTAQQMVDMAKEQGWASINIADGHPLMTRAAWVQAKGVGLAVEGFEPTAHDEKVRQLVGRSDLDIESIKHEIMKPQ